MLPNKLRLVKNNYKEQSKSIIFIPVDCIRPNPYQPRKKFNKLSLDELCDSIKQYGVLQPINIRKLSNSIYELVAGERRLRASILAGLKEIPSIIIEISDNDSAIISLIENLQREDLSYIEEAEGYNNLISEHGFTQEELAVKIGKSQSTIANKIRLLKLPPLVKKILSDHNLTERHARALLKLHDEQLQLTVLKRVCEKGYNVKKTEDLVEKTIQKFSIESNSSVETKKIPKAIKDIRIFVNTIKQSLEIMKKAGVYAKAAQLDRGTFFEFIIRIPK